MTLRSAVAIAAAAFALLAFWLWTPDRDRAALEAVYLQAPTDLVQVAGWRLHARDSGPRNAPAIVLISASAPACTLGSPGRATCPGPTACCASICRAAV